MGNWLNAATSLDKKSTIKEVNIAYILSLLKLCNDFMMTRPKRMTLFNNKKDILKNEFFPKLSWTH